MLYLSLSLFFSLSLSLSLSHTHTHKQTPPPQADEQPPVQRSYKIQLPTAPAPSKAVARVLSTGLGMQCQFSGVEGMLLLLLPREVCVCIYIII